MTSISLREFIDDILLLARNNNVSESEDFSRVQIANWIDAYKHALLKDRLDRQKKDAQNDDELADVIDGLFIREVGPLELEEVVNNDGTPSYTKRTVKKLQNVYDDSSSSILAVHDQNGCIIQYMDHTRRHYHYSRKYTYGEMTAYFDDGHIYVQGLQDKGLLKYIWVEAIYSTTDDNEDEDVDEDDIKIPNWMVPAIKNNILENELAFILNRPSDDSNNATLASVKPHGPQDKEQ